MIQESEAISPVRGGNGGSGARKLPCGSLEGELGLNLPRSLPSSCFPDTHPRPPVAHQGSANFLAKDQLLSALQVPRCRPPSPRLVWDKHRHRRPRRQRAQRVPGTSLVAPESRFMHVACGRDCYSFARFQSFKGTERILVHRPGRSGQPAGRAQACPLLRRQRTRTAREHRGRRDTARGGARCCQPLGSLNLGTPRGPRGPS